MNWTQADIEALIRRTVYPELGRLKRKLLGAAVRGFITLVKDDLKTQQVQIGALEGEEQDLVERFQNYGFTGVPLVDAEALMLSVGGSRSHTICILVNDPRYRPTGLKKGDTAQYDYRGQILKMTDEGVLIETDKPVITTSNDIRSGANAEKRIMQEDLISAIQTVLGTGQVVVAGGSSAGTYSVTFTGLSAFSTAAQAARSTVHKTE